MKNYNVAEIQEKLQVTRNWVYYRFLRVEKYKKWITEDTDGKMAISEKGFRELKKEVEEQNKAKVREEQERNAKTYDNEGNNEHIREIELLKARIEELTKLIETQRETIRSLDKTIERLLKLNENNQILLLNEQSRNLEKVEKLGLVARLKKRLGR